MRCDDAINLEEPSKWRLRPALSLEMAFASKACWQMEERRSRAVLADLPDRDAEAAGLVYKIGLDAAAGGDQHPDRQCF